MNSKTFDTLDRGINSLKSMINHARESFASFQKGGSVEYREILSETLTDAEEDCKTILEYIRSARIASEQL